MTAPAWLVSHPIAHRGLHAPARGILENTPSAAEAAIAGGYAIECDVQISSDGEAMVFHDHALDRLTADKGPTRARSAAELGALTIRGSRDPILTLAAFLDRIAGRTPLVIEIKSRFDGDERLARRTVEIVAGRDEPLALKSFDPAIVSLLRRIAPELPRGIVAQGRYEGGEWDALDPARRHAMASLEHWDETRPSFISYRHLDLPNQAVVMPRILDGIPVMTWTIRDQDEADRVSAFADQIVFEGFIPA